MRTCECEQVFQRQPLRRRASRGIRARRRCTDRDGRQRQGHDRAAVDRRHRVASLTGAAAQ